VFGPLLPLVLLIVLLLWLFRGTATAMVAIWSRSDTFAHAFLVPPLVAWMIWRRRDILSGLPLAPSPAWLIPIAMTCGLWLLGEAAGVNAATQFALLALVVLSVPALLGWPLARALAFPLLFLFFAVPIGEFMVEPMMDWTADFTVAALRMSGIPVYREGLQFVIPSGNWSVVEACSGVRYLIASFMVGTLFAYLNYRSTSRRLLFVAVSLVVPVVANWLRAYMIVMLGHYSGNTIATGVDHLVYGWLFFGIVIALMFMVGARFADPLDAPAPTPMTGVVRTGNVRARTPWWAALCVALLAALTLGIDARFLKSEGAQAERIALPEDLPGGWVVSEQPLSEWVPAFQNPGVVATRTYRSGRAAVGVWIGHYRHQSRDRKLITSSNSLVGLSSRTWLPVPAPSVSMQAGARAVTLRSALLRTPADPKATPTQRLRVLQVYRVARTLTANDTEARLQLAVSRLLGRGDDGAVLFFSTEVGEDGRGDVSLEDFVVRHLDAFIGAVDAAGAAGPSSTASVVDAVAARP
jgi:exosortase A